MADSTRNIATGVVATGVTTIFWGTVGVMANAAGANSDFYVVTRFNEKPLSENMKFPQGNGLTSTRVIVSDGVVWELTVRDDSRMTPPALNVGVYVQDGAGLITSGRLLYPCRVVESAYDTAPKQPGERVLTVERLNLIEAAGI